MPPHTGHSFRPLNQQRDQVEVDSCTKQQSQLCSLNELIIIISTFTFLMLHLSRLNYAKMILQRRIIQLSRRGRVGDEDALLVTTTTRHEGPPFVPRRPKMMMMIMMRVYRNNVDRLAALSLLFPKQSPLLII